MKPVNNERKRSEKKKETEAALAERPQKTSEALSATEEPAGNAGEPSSAKRVSKRKRNAHEADKEFPLKARRKAKAEAGNNPETRITGRWLSHAQLKALGINYTKGQFSHDEERILLDAVKRFQEENGLSDEALSKEIFKSRRATNPNYKQTSFWTEISHALPNRPLISVYNFLRRKKHDGYKSGKWTAEEDTLLLQLQKEFGNKWESIGDRIGRQGSDCRDRFRDVHQRGTQGKWTADEVQRLRDSVAAESDKANLPWSVIALKVGTRNPQQCRLKYNKLM